MSRFVIDPPTLVLIAAGEIEVHPDHRLVGPASLRSQALALLYDLVTRDELTEREALRRHERLTECKLRLLGDRVSRRTAWNLAREQGWPDLADAEYIAVARLQADALATSDPDLTAKAEGLVPIVAPTSVAAP